jgi:TRAP-type transport system large permease protein
MLTNKPRGVARPASMAQRRRCEGVLDMAPTMPIVKQAGIDPVYFGVLFITNNAIGLATSPVGVVLNVVCGVSRISMEGIIKGVWSFIIAQLIVLFLMILFPALVTVPAKWFSG